MRARFTPLERFRKVNGRVQLRYGDLAVLAEATGRTAGHIARTITRERRSAELEAQLAALVGVPVTHIDLPRQGRDAPGRDAQHARRERHAEPAAT